MTKDVFIQRLRKFADSLACDIQAKDGSWSVKGFIDTKRDIYTISLDTKVISKVVELYIFPRICRFAADNSLSLELTSEQNFYPDMTFRDNDGNLFAVDVKTSYRRNSTHINGMTLGAFTGYFRNRSSAKNTVHPYSEYKAHVVLGLVYSLAENVSRETEVFRLEKLDDIRSVVKDFQFFVHEKWRIATDRPGSGNTKNIGSVSEVASLIAGNGPFATLGEDVFDDYWTNYLTYDMARKAELAKPYYANLAEYKTFRGMT